MTKNGGRLLIAAAFASCLILLVAGAGKPGSAAPAAAKALTTENQLYDGEGRLAPPADYRTWVFLSAGVDMSYSADAPAAKAHGFDNVFAPRAAYEAFKATGRWPEKTVLILENRAGAAKGSINTRGLYQTGAVTGLEAHVKDLSRFRGGWGFFAFEGDQAATPIAYSANCFSCHEAHAAADTTFVQFYPTLLPIAEARGTINPAYAAEKASSGR